MLQASALQKGQMCDDSKQGDGLSSVSVKKHGKVLLGGNTRGVRHTLCPCGTSDLDDRQGKGQKAVSNL